MLQQSHSCQRSCQNHLPKLPKFGKGPVQREHSLGHQKKLSHCRLRRDPFTFIFVGGYLAEIVTVCQPDGLTFLLAKAEGREHVICQHPPTTAQTAVDRNFPKTTVVRKTIVNYFICGMPIV